MENTIDKKEANVKVEPKLVFIIKGNGQLVLKIKFNDKRA